MKKEYKKPLAEMIKFVPEDDIMDGLDIGDDDDDIGFGSGSSVEEW